ncbi:MAG: META domain-containing protein [Alphaproteobacteria bacterium]|nr:META domain-containing protein [Alphaproteobacteria bacterium]
MANMNLQGSAALMMRTARSSARFVAALAAILVLAILVLAILLLASLVLVSFLTASGQAQSLTGGAWRISELVRQKLDAKASAQTSVQFDPAARRVSATAGCNRMGGGYESAGQRLRFSQIISTRMACPGARDARERAFIHALENTRSWRIEKSELLLLDGQGAVLVRLRRAQT